MATFTVTLTNGDTHVVEARHVYPADGLVKFFDTTHHDAHDMFGVVNVLHIHRHPPVEQ